MQVHPILISGSDSLKNQLTAWKHVHQFSSEVLIWSNTGEQLTCWIFTLFCQWLSGQTLEITHMLNAYSPSLVSSSDLVRYWRATYILDVSSPILVSGFNLAKHLRDSHSGHIFNHSSQWSWSAQTLESNSHPKSTHLSKKSCPFPKSYQIALQKYLSGFSNFCY